MSTDEITNKQLYEEIVKNKTELRQVIEASETRVLLKLESLNNKIKKLEKENQQFKNKIEYLERENRKNNLVIFGLHKNNKEVSVAFICEKIKDLLGVHLLPSDINNLYTLGSAENSPVKLELISYLKKTEIFQNCKKLKGTKIYFSNDLTENQRNEYKILREHLKQAKANTKDRCYIKGNKLFVNNIVYTAEDLHHEEEPIPKNRSAPLTPVQSYDVAYTTLVKEKEPDRQVNIAEKESEATTSLEKNQNSTPKSATIRKSTNQIAMQAQEKMRGRLRSSK